GKKTGIFTSWPECERQVSGYAGAKYKSFKTQAEALQWLQDGGKIPSKKTQAPKKEVTKINPHAINLWTDDDSRNHGNKKQNQLKNGNTLNTMIVPHGLFVRLKIVRNIQPQMESMVVLITKWKLWLY